jgi:hypothetical protein
MNDSVLNLFFKAGATLQELLPVTAIAVILFGMFFVPSLNMFKERKIAAVVSVCAVILALGGITQGHLQLIYDNYGKATLALLFLLTAGVVLFWKLRTKWPF